MASTKPPPIAIVEDDPDVRDSLRAVVTAMGYGCVVFDSAESLLEDGPLPEFSCLLVDFNLPGMNGMDLLSRLQQSGDTPQACLYTGQINSRVREASATLRNTKVLEKGSDADSIAEYLRSVLADTP